MTEEERRKRSEEIDIAAEDTVSYALSLIWHAIVAYSKLWVGFVVLFVALVLIIWGFVTIIAVTGAPPIH